jgi:hypothetical protein
MPGKANCCCPARMQHSALFLVFVARTGARTCRCALERPAFAGAALVERRGKLPHRRGRQSRLRAGLRLFGFDVWFASLERGREREPSGGRVRPGTIAAAAGVAGGSPGTCRPAGSPVGRLFIPAGTEPEFRLQWHLECRCFVHCGCRGLNMYVFLARSRVFSSFSSTRTRLLVI